MKIAIFGAGQAGRMIRNWIPAGNDLVCYIDNNEKKQGTRLDGVPVMRMEDALLKNPELIWISTFNSEAAASIQQQLRDGGYEGKTETAIRFREEQDLRLSSVRMLAEEIRKGAIEGAIAELGVYQGELAVELNRLFPDRRIVLFDTFEGFAASDIEKEEAYANETHRHRDFSNTSVELVRGRLPHPETAEFIAGFFPESLEQLKDRDEIRFAMVSLDPDLYEPVRQGLVYFYPRMSPGGVIVIHDYNSTQYPGVRSAVQEYCRERSLVPVPLSDLHGTAVLVKEGGRL
jgi:O-methyltransferase